MANHYRNILVAIDGSKSAEYAFRKAIQVSLRNVGSTLYIANIIDNRVFLAVDVADRQIIERVEQESRELLNSYIAEAEAAGVENVKAILEHGSPRTLIPTVLPEKLNVDLILCGATGRNAVGRFIIGSVSQEIVRQAKCDVLVIRTPEQ